MGLRHVSQKARRPRRVSDGITSSQKIATAMAEARIDGAVAFDRLLSALHARGKAAHRTRRGSRRPLARAAA